MSTRTALRRCAVLAAVLVLAPGTGAGAAGAAPAAPGPSVRLSAPLYDSPGAVVPVIVTVVRPPAGAATSLQLTATDGGTVRCTAQTWRNPVQASVSRKCFVTLPRVSGSVSLTGTAVLTASGSPPSRHTTTARRVVARGPASATPTAAAVAQVERCWNTTPYVRLTFDDGGSAAQVGSLLSTLRRNDVRGTFFFRGDWAAAHPSLMRAIRADGHEVGNHSYDHPALSSISDSAVLSQIARGTAGTGTPRLLRPPYGAGAYSSRLADLAASRGYRLCRWTADTYDWDQQSVAAMTQRIRYGDHRSPPVAAGGTILMHGSAAATVTGLQAIIDTVRRKGLVLQPRTAAVRR